MTETEPKDQEPQTPSSDPPTPVEGEPRAEGPSAVEIEELRKKARERDEYLNDLKRVQAEFSNFQKRNKQEREGWTQLAIGSLVRELLPALDSFDLAVQACAGVSGVERFVEGLKIAEREVFRVLEKQGLTPINTKGKAFDPYEHEVVAVVETADYPDQMVVDEVRKGWRLGDRLVRPAQVRVSRAPQPKPAPEGEAKA